MAETDLVDLPDDFDRLLRQELSIEPSPAFAARVRADAAARPRAAWAGWLLPLAGAAALVVAALVWMPSLDRTAGTLPAAVPAPPVVASPTIVTSPLVAESSTPPRIQPKTTEIPGLVVGQPRPVRARSQRSVLPAAAASPVVIVDQNQRAALTMMVAMIEKGRLTADAFAKTTPQSTDSIADQLVPITIAPLTVSTMTPGGVLQNDRQHQ